WSSISGRRARRPTRRNILVALAVQNAATFLFELAVVLTGIDRPEQGHYRGRHQHDAEWDEEKHNTHRAGSWCTSGSPAPTPSRVRRVFLLSGPASRAAFATTMSELIDMPMAATHGATHPSAARGIAEML